MALPRNIRCFSLFFVCLLSCSLCLMEPADAAAGGARHKDRSQDAGSQNVLLERARNNPAMVYGVASWYGSDFNMGPTASGVPYNMYTFTAAHRTLPFGTIVRVTDQYSGRSVMVCITDRGPFSKGRIIDMSYAAAETLHMKNRGVARVGLEVVSDDRGRPLNAGQAFFVEMKSPAGPERLGPYDSFADAAAMHEAMLVAHPEASVVLAERGSDR